MIRPPIRHGARRPRPGDRAAGTPGTARPARAGPDGLPGCADRPAGGDRATRVPAGPALGRADARRVAAGARRPARRLPAAPAGPAGRPAARGGRRLHRRRQVDPGQQPGPGPGQRRRRAPPDHPLAGAGLQPGRHGLVPPGRAAARPDPHHRAERRPAHPATGRRPGAHRRAGLPRRARHRLGGRRQPGARRANCSPPPTSGCSSPPPPGTPTPCPGSCCAPPGPRGTVDRHGARPGAAGGGRRDRRPPRRDAGRPRTWPPRRCSCCRRPRSTGRACCRSGSPPPLRGWFGRLAADAEARVGGGPADPGRRARRAAPRPSSELADAADEQAGRGRRAGRAGPGRVPQRPADRSSRASGTAGCCAARCWPAGRSSSAPASSSAPWRPGSAGCATGWSRRSPAARRPAGELQNAIESQLVTLLRGVAADAAENAYTGWQAHPAGAGAARAGAGPARRPTCPSRAERLVRDWQRGVLDLVRAEGGDKRFVARTAAYAVNATGLAVMIAVFASTAFIPTGLEVATGAGTTVAAQAVLQAIFGDQAVRDAGRARPGRTCWTGSARCSTRRPPGTSTGIAGGRARRRGAGGRLRRAAAERRAGPHARPASPTATPLTLPSDRRPVTNIVGKVTRGAARRPAGRRRRAGRPARAPSSSSSPRSTATCRTPAGRRAHPGRAGRHPAGAVPRPHRRRAGRRHRQRQVQPVQRAGPARALPGRGAPADHRRGARLRLGAARTARPAARLDRRAAPAPVRPGERAGRRRRGRPARPGPARPARLRLGRAGAPAGGGPAARPGRPGGLGGRPAEVRRPGRAHQPTCASSTGTRTSRWWCSTRPTGCPRPTCPRVLGDLRRLLDADGLDGRTGAGHRRPSTRPAMAGLRGRWSRRSPNGRPRCAGSPATWTRSSTGWPR